MLRVSPAPPPSPFLDLGGPFVYTVADPQPNPTEELAKLIGHPDPAKAEVEIMDPVDWDAGGRYKDVIDAVRRAGEGNDVRVYRVAKGGVRAEYWVLTTTADSRLVGLKALAVES